MNRQNGPLRRKVFITLLCLLLASVWTALPASAAPPTQGGERKAQADALFGDGEELYSAGKYQAAVEKYEAALEIYREIGDRTGEGTTLNNVGSIYARVGQYQQALDHFEQALITWQEIGDRAWEGVILSNIGFIYQSVGQYGEALDYYEQALSILREIGDRAGEGTALNNVGFIYDSLGQYGEALDYYQQALSIRREMGDRAGEGVSLSNIGVIYGRLGQYEKALRYFQQALSIRQEIGDRAGEGTTLNNIGSIYTGVGQYQQALDYYRQALDIAQEIGDRAKEGIALNNIGSIYQDLGQYQQALDHYQQALSILQEIGDRAGEGATLNNIGFSYSRFGQFREALDYYRQALSILQQIGDRAGEGSSLNNVGFIYDSLGQYQEALDYYQQALTIRQEIGDRAGEGGSLNNIGAIYHSLGQYQEALDYYQQALTIRQEIGDRRGMGESLNNIGGIYQSLGQYQEALDYYQQALSIQQEIGDRAGEGATLNNIGFIYERLEQYQEALGYYQRALTIRQEIGDRAGEGANLNNMGAIYHSLGQYQEAFDYYEQALTIAQEGDLRALEGTTLTNIGFTYERLGQYQQALDCYRQAIEVIESMAGEMTVEEFKSSFAAEQMHVYEGIIPLLIQMERPDEAFGYVERARARAFLDQLGNQRVDFRRGAAPELIDQEQAQRQRIIGLQNALSAERAKPFDQQSQELLDRLSADLEEARQKRAELISRLKLASPEYASLVSVDPLTLEEVQALLDEQTTLIEYFVTAEQTLAFVVTHDGLQVVEIEVARQELASHATYLRDLITAHRPQAEQESAQRLYELLVKPLEPHIHPSHRLGIVPHGVLHYLPFAALRDGQTTLIQKHVLFFLPSASVLQFVLDKRKPDLPESRELSGRLLALGNPATDLPALPFAEQEAQAIAALYGTTPLIGDQASEGRLRALAANHRLLHIAAHGSFDPHNPLFSALHLAADAEHDGRLEVHEVYGLNLAQADLVVLSACSTQLGQLSAGDELVGLNRAFIYAGTPAIVASLWPVDDAATAALMERFYRHLREGYGKAEALRAAQLEMMEEKEAAYYWAGFSLAGDWGVGKQAESGGGLCGGLAALLIVGLVGMWLKMASSSLRLYLPGVVLCLSLVLLSLIAVSASAQEGTPPAQARRAFDEGQELFNVGEWRAAAAAFEQALLIYRQSGDQPGEADALFWIAACHEALGEHEQALDGLEQALSIERSLGRRRDEVLVLNSIGLLHLEQRLWEDALARYEDAREALETLADPMLHKATMYGLSLAQDALDMHGDAVDTWERLGVWPGEEDWPQDGAGMGHKLWWLAEATARYQAGHPADRQLQSFTSVLQMDIDLDTELSGPGTVGGVYNRARHADELVRYQTALKAARVIGNLAREGQALATVGHIHGRRGRHQQALEHYQGALTIERDLGRREREIGLLNDIAFVYDKQRRYEEALRYYQDALAMAQEDRDQDQEATLRNNIGALQTNLGRYEQALEQHLAALEIWEALGMRLRIGISENNIGSIYFGLGRYDEALEHYQAALSIAQELGDQAGEAKALSNIGAIFARLGQYEEALAQYQAALVIMRAIGDEAGEGTKLNNIATAYGQLGQHEAALVELLKALEIAQKLGDPLKEATVLDNIGFLYEQREQFQGAIHFYRRAVDVLETVQGEFQVEELASAFAAGQTSLYARLIGLLGKTGKPGEAFSYAERARARAFLSQIGNQQVDFRQGADPKLIERGQKLRQKMTALQNALNDERAKPLDQQDPTLLDELSTELEQARDDYAELLTRLKLESPEYASLVSVNTLNPEEVQARVLDEHTALIEYFVMDDQTLAWVVDRDRFELVNLEITRDDLRNRVAFLRDLISDRDFDTTKASDLYNTLFAPLKPYIRHPNLVIVPHGVLHYLPFAALWDAENERYLLQDYALTYAPSASVLTFILEKRTTDEGRLLALGNPDGSLPHAATEATAIAGLYGTTPLLGRRAAERQVHARAGQLDVLHLAAHGVYNPFNPLFTCIELSPDGDHDGNLEVHEVFGLDLTGTNLVVLSACETALGEQSEGDELVGLTRAFLYAGTPSVVTTLWAVDDAASAALMESFYRHLREGLATAEALRAAQLDMLAQDERRTPYYWAAFSLTGDHRGDGEPGAVPEKTPTAVTAEAPTSSIPIEETQPTPDGTGRGLCGSASLPLGLVILASINRKRKRHRTRL